MVMIASWKHPKLKRCHCSLQKICKFPRPVPASQLLVLFLKKNCVLTDPLGPPNWGPLDGCDGGNLRGFGTTDCGPNMCAIDFLLS